MASIQVNDISEYFGDEQQFNYNQTQKKFKEEELYEQQECSILEDYPELQDISENSFYDFDDHQDFNEKQGQQTQFYSYIDDQVQFDNDGEDNDYGEEQYFRYQENQIMFQQQQQLQQNQQNNQSFSSDSSTSFITNYTNKSSLDTRSQLVTTMYGFLSDKTQKIIKDIFQQKIIKYGRTIFNNINKKEQDIQIFESVLKKFKFSYRYDKNHDPRCEMNKLNIKYDPEFDDEGTVDYLVHDTKIKVFFLKVNPVTIYCNLKHNLFIQNFLEELDSFLREVFGSSICIRSFNNKNIPTFQRRLELSFLNGINDPPTQFIIRCGTKQLNTMKYLDILISQYANIISDSRIFEKMASFICFWGLERKILSDEYLNEYAFLILIIYFCQIQSVLPVLHDYKKDVYEKCTKINDKIKKKQINLKEREGKKQFQKELEQLEEYDYFIYRGPVQNKIDGKKKLRHQPQEIQVVPLDFPKPITQDPKNQDSRDAKIRKQINENFIYPRNSNLGMLVTQFFFTMAYEVPQMNKCITIDGKPQLVTEYPGYSILNPILGNNLTEHLYKNSDQYKVVQEEFERAFLCISGQKTLRFQDLCTKYKP